MMPSAPTAQRSSAPPVNMLYMPSNPPPSFEAFSAKNFVNAAPSSPGIGIMAATRQIPSTIRVKTIRDFSSGILKQLAKVLTMFAIMGGGDRGRYFAAGAACFKATTSQAPPLASIFDLADAL